MNDHRRVVQMLARRAELLPHEERQVQEHLQRCSACRRVAADFATQTQLLRSLPIVVPPPSLRHNILVEARRASPPRFVHMPGVARILGRGVVAAVVLTIAVIAVHQLHFSSPRSGASALVHATPLPTSATIAASPVPNLVKPPVVGQLTQRHAQRKKPAAGGGSIASYTRPISHVHGSVYPQVLATVTPFPRQQESSPAPRPIVISDATTRRLVAAVPPHEVSGASRVGRAPLTRPPPGLPARRTVSVSPTSVVPSPQPTPVPTSTAGSSTAGPAGASHTSSTPFPVPSIPPTPTPIPLRVPAFIPAPPPETPTPLTTPIP